MGLSHAPRVITDGLVLGLDAANTRSYVGSGTTWTDLIGSNNGTLTNGPVFTQEPKLEPFGGAGAVEFGGSADGLYTPNITLGSNDWTLEFWIYLTSTGTARGLYSYFLNTTTARSISCYIDSSNQIVLRHRINDGTYPTATGSTALSAHTWYHVAAVRVNDDYYIYINGVQDASYTSAPAGHTYYADGVPHYIGYNRNATSDFDGLLSNVRLVNGTALYTSNFTPPRKKLEVTSDTVLLTCEKGAIKDRSSSAHAITVTGDAHSITGASYFKFDGSNDYIAINQFDHTATNTVEMWFKKTADVLYACPYAWGFLPSQRWQFSSGDENMNIYYDTNNGGTQVSEDSGINVTTLEGWVQIVVTADYNNDEYKTYKNGSLVQTGDLNNQDWSYVGSQSYNFIDICRNVNNNNGFMSGNVSVLRIYRKVLTASEIEQNFNALRGRYGI